MNNPVFQRNSSRVLVLENSVGAVGYVVPQ